MLELLWVFWGLHLFCFIFVCKGPEEYEVYNNKLSSSLTYNTEELTGLEYHSFKLITLLKLV